MLVTGRLPRHLPAALLLVALAAACRFALFDLVEFKYDEAQVGSLALGLLRQHVVPPTSVNSSGGFHNPPMVIYLIALPLLFSPSPLVLTGFVVALNALAAGGLYLTCRRALGEVTALMAGLLFAVNPLAVHYARKAWAPDLMPPFTVLLLAGMLAALSEGRAWGLAAAVISLAVMVQLHQAAVALVPVVLLLVLLFGRLLPRRPVFWAVLGVGAAIAALLSWPYASFEASIGYADLHGFAGQATVHPALTGEPWLLLWWLAAGWRPELFFEPLTAQEHIHLAGSGLVDWLVLALLLLGLLCCAVWLARPKRELGSGGSAGPRHRRVLAATLLFSTLAPPLLMTRLAAPVFPHYLVFLLPLLCLLTASGISATGAVLCRLRRPAGVAQGAVLLLLVLVVGAAGARMTGFNRRLVLQTAGGDYGTPLHYSLAAATMVRAGVADVPPGQARVFVMDRHDDLPAVYRYFAAIGLAPAAASVDPERAQVVPTAATRAGYLDDPAGATFRSPPSGLLSVPIPPVAQPAYRLLWLDQPALRSDAPAQGSELRPIGPFSVAGSVELVGSAVSRPSAVAPFDVTLRWQVDDPTPVGALPARLFVHLYDAARKTVAQDDALGYANADWRRGDRFVTWFHLQPTQPLPPASYTLVAGLYTVQGFHVYPVRGPHGENLGGEIPLGTVTISAAGGR